MLDQIFSYREMCDNEDVQTLQRGMNFRLNPAYSVILMSRRANAPYKDKIYADGVTIEYEGHDLPKSVPNPDPKAADQPRTTVSGTLTQNGLFAAAVENYKSGDRPPELIKVYEKILNGVWSLKGFFKLIDCNFIFDGKRKVFRFILKLTHPPASFHLDDIDLKHTRLIPAEVKKEVWKRDGGRCVICGSNRNLHFDHDLPYSKGGTSLLPANVRLLCAKHNLAKSDKIE